MKLQLSLTPQESLLLRGLAVPEARETDVDQTNGGDLMLAVEDDSLAIILSAFKQMRADSATE